MLGNHQEGVELFLPDQATACCAETAPLARAIRGEIVEDAEFFVRLPDRGGLWISANARPLCDKNGQRRGGMVVVRNISERKRAEEELRRSRERFELAVKGSQDGLWDWDLQTNEVFFSPRWKSIIGHEDHEIAHHLKEWEIRLHPDEKEDVLAANYAHQAGTTPHYEYEYRLQHKDGTYRWILARGVCLRDKEGRAYRMAGSHVDVTARRQVEQALKESEDRYRAVLASLEAGILVLDSDGIIREGNAAAERLLGVPHGTLAGSSILDVPWNLLDEASTALPLDRFPPLTALRTGQGCNGVLLGVPSAGQIRWVRVNAEPLFRPAQAMPYAVVTSFQPATAR
ncbi:MAG: PAS domain S-box protein, partial [Gemmataceae bacterium]